MYNQSKYQFVAFLKKHAQWQWEWYVVHQPPTYSYPLYTSYTLFLAYTMDLFDLSTYQHQALANASKQLV